jgi:hypothetical protein
MITISSSPDILGAIFAQADVLDPLSILKLLTSSQFNSVYNTAVGDRSDFCPSSRPPQRSGTHLSAISASPTGFYGRD